MKNSFNKLIGIIISLATLALAACSSHIDHPLRVGTNFWAGYEPIYLARSLNFYDDTQIHLAELPSASEVIHAFRNETLDVAALTLDEALTLLADGIDLKVILVMDYSYGSDVLLAKPNIKSLQDLTGKRVAVETTAVGAILLNGALETANISVSDITIENCQFDQHLECYNSSDAIITYEPLKTQLINKGANVIFDSSQIPGKIIDVLVAHNRVVKNHPEGLKKLISGYYKARDHLSKHPDDASKKMSDRMGISPKEVLLSYEGLKLPSIEENISLLSGEYSDFDKTTNELAKFLYERKLLKKEITVTKLSDPSFLPH